VVAEEASSDEESVEESEGEEESTELDVAWLRANYACSQQEATRALEAAKKQGKTREAAGRAMQKHWSIPRIIRPKGKREKRQQHSSRGVREEPEKRGTVETASKPTKERRKQRDASEAMEFREHVTATKTKERRRDSTLGVMREALAQLNRRQRGKVLTREQQQLADLGETLSPARVYGVQRLQSRRCRESQQPRCHRGSK
jgi:hypothetical protein